jgi:hypothetical protein
LREDAREAREFAYGDVVKAFETFLKQRGNSGGFIIAGLEQGGLMAERLVSQRIDQDEALKSKLVAAYFIETLSSSGVYNKYSTVPACLNRTQTGCIISYLSVDSGRPDRAMLAERRAVMWDKTWTLIPLDDKPLCVNPINGSMTEAEINARHSLGAANATGLEWGIMPALITRKVSARCKGGLLYVSKPSGASFKSPSAWIDRKKVSSYNLFYGDLKADAEERWFNFQYRKPLTSQP